jgi:hypothetical protein
MLRKVLQHAVLVCVAGICGTAFGQTPAPFPRPDDAQRPGQKPTQPPPVTQPTTPPAVSASPQKPGAPDERTLGVPLYPGSEFLASYDAGRGQRYYLFGTNTPFAEIVNYYRSVLKQRGELVYEEPPIHMFDVGRFREETMAFPPGVTVKDYTWGGSQGYMNPKRGAQPARFRTVIQIVPSPEGSSQAGK